MTRNRVFRQLVLALIVLLMFTAAALAALRPVALRCEYRVNPLGLDEPRPRLTWRVESPERGQRQMACQIQVATSEALLRKSRADLWDSGRVMSDKTVNVAYAGKPLTSREACYWRVQVWDKDGKPNWSEIAFWTMGLLASNDWRAEYISFRDTTPVHKDAQTLFLPAARQYRDEFSAARKVKRATVYATALGVYELYLNGERLGDAVFAPGWTDYHQRAYYWTYDVTPLVRKGRNAIGAWVADGWYSGYIGFGLVAHIGTERIGRYTYGKTPAIMAQLEIEYADGSRETVVTDGSWKASDAGPIQEADLLMGETYDARKEQPGWTKPGFDDSGWESAILARNNGSAAATFYEFQNGAKLGDRAEIKGHLIDLGFKRPPKLEAFPGMPVRPTQEIAPIAITSPTNGVHIFDLGQNFAGVVRLKVKGRAGTVVQMRYGEMLHPDGQLMTENLRKARATDHYILRGDSGDEVYVPRFTYHGFRYVELTGLPGKPRPDAITGIVLHSDTPLTSGFECSDPIANRLFQNVLWTQRANFVDLPTDCPQRDERLGWTGDAQVYVRTAAYNADVAAFYTKWLRELMESQRPSGTFPGYAPFPFQYRWDFGTAWCDAAVICPWEIWQAYDDTRIVERCWPRLVQFLEWRKTTSRNFLGINHGNDWGDWLNLNDPTSIEYIDTIYFAYDARLMADMARALGRGKDEADYRALFDNIKAAFKQKYVKSEGSLTKDSQTAYDLALFVDLIPTELRKAAGKILADKLRKAETSDNSGMTTGFLGTRPLLPVLSSVGENDLAVKHFQSRKYPSWGYEVEQGATTIWECWNSYTKDKGLGGAQHVQMDSSFAHYAFGAVCEWMMSTLAGIATDGPGYKRIIIRPSPPSPGSNPDREPINWVKAHYDSIHGRIVSNWRLKDGRFVLETTIPANSTATVYVPAKSAESVTESGAPLDKAKNVKFLRMEGDRVVLVVESGSYRFTAQP
jgi:alpha-L-rhamnosidase